MLAPRIFGSPTFENIKAVRRAGFHPRNRYLAILDRSSLWEPKTIDDIVRECPKPRLNKEDLYLLLTECVANAAMHGKAEALGFSVRQKRRVLLLSFFQTPAMSEGITRALAAARRGARPDYANEAAGGLGFPILLKLARHVTISSDCAKLLLWFRIRRFSLFN